jgi:hypothetical protein
MDIFEYAFTAHAARDFRQLIYFCTPGGECGLEEAPEEEAEALARLFNERGAQGWELVQLLFGGDGLLACWKRRIGRGD